jgi:diacylglycerol kinase family enzyme
VGLDASVVERVDAHPRRKARFGAWYYSYAALGIFNRRYLIRPPRVRVIAAGRELEGVTVIVQNSDPFTYFRKRPIRVAESAALDNGSLSLAVLTKATPFELPTLIPRLLSGRQGMVARHRQVVSLPCLDTVRVEALGGEPFPVQVDGDYIGLHEEAEYRSVPRGLMAVS